MFDTADAYLAGHDHVLEILPADADCAALQVVSGGGGQALYSLNGNQDTLLEESTFGFVLTRAYLDRMEYEAYNSAADLLYAMELAKQ